MNVIIGRLHVQKILYFIKKIACIVLISVVIFYLSLLFATAPKLLNQENSSKAFLDQKGTLIKVTLTSDEKYRVYLPLNQIPKEIIDSTIAYEDRYFFYHIGVNPLSLLRSLFKSLLTSRLYGGSTLTMQLARVRLALKTRNFWGKLKQIYYALLIEAHYTKDEILEAYFNLAPYGGNIEGIAAASFLLLNKHPNNLTLNDAFWLSLIPQSPTARNPLKKEGKAALLKIGATTPNQKSINNNYSYSPSFTRKQQTAALHFIDRITPLAKSGIIQTTLNLQQQTDLEATLQEYITQNKAHGIKNANILVVDSNDMSVASYIGSANYLNKEILGFVTGLTAKRSPGSTIKPFIYALALQQGILTPDTLLKDTPLNIATYVPDNFEKNFLGPITAGEALIRSRNIPAIYVMNQLKSPRLYEFLNTVGVELKKAESYYGLALALGGFELSMEELAALYGAFVNGGRYKKLVFLKEQLRALPQSTTNQILAPEAAYLILDMLKNNPRPAYEFTEKQNNSALLIPWKTGTSYSSKDAWSIGFVGHYLVGVWIGNFDGSSNPNFVGRDIAGPLFFKVAEYLQGEAQLSFPAPKEKLSITTNQICALSGKPANPFCPHKKLGVIIPGISAIKQCDIHREVLVDKDERFLLCNSAPKEKLLSAHKKVYEFLDSDILHLFELANLKRKTPPPLIEECQIDEAKFSLVKNTIHIGSPTSNTIYKIPEGKNKATLPFYAVTQSSATNLYWFIDNKLVNIESAASAATSFTKELASGEYAVRVSDGVITSEEVVVRVER